MMSIERDVFRAIDTRESPRAKTNGLIKSDAEVEKSERNDQRVNDRRGQIEDQRRRRQKPKNAGFQTAVLFRKRSLKRNTTVDDLDLQGFAPTVKPMLDLLFQPMKLFDQRQQIVWCAEIFSQVWVSVVSHSFYGIGRGRKDPSPRRIPSSARLDRDFLFGLLRFGGFGQGDRQYAVLEGGLDFSRVDTFRDTEGPLEGAVVTLL